MRIAWLAALGLAAGMGGTTAAVAPAAQALPRATIPNLVAYWDFEEASGTTANDVTGNGNTGTHNGGVSIVTNASPYPNSTRSLQFDQAAGAYVLVPHNATQNLPGSFTLAAWARTTLDSTVQQGMIEKFGTNTGYILRLNASEYISFQVRSATTSNISTAPRTVALNTWTHIAGVYNASGGTQVMYKDGVADATMGTPPVAPSVASTDPLRLGRDYGSNGFNGQLDEIRIYSKALTVGELGILRTGQAAPTNLLAVGGFNQIDLTWTEPAPVAGVNVTYAVKRSPPGANTWTILVQGLTTAYYSDTGLGSLESWDYAVTAVSVDESAPTAPATAQTFSTIPRTNDHDEGLFDDKCACGSSIPGPTAAAALIAVLALLLLGAARRA